MEDFAALCRSSEIYRSRLIYNTYKTAQVIHTPGDVIDRIGIVANGILKAVESNRSGEEHCAAYFDTGDIFPEFLYFAGDKKYTYTLIAARRTLVAWIPAPVFEKMLWEDAMMAHALMLHISRRGLKNQILLDCIGYKTIRQRIACWLVSMGKLEGETDIVIPGSQIIWANTLRVTRSSLNQELKKMEEEGYFVRGPGILRLVDRDMLEELL